MRLSWQVRWARGRGERRQYEGARDPLCGSREDRAAGHQEVYSPQVQQPLPISLCRPSIGWAQPLFARQFAQAPSHLESRCPLPQSRRRKQGGEASAEGVSCEGFSCEGVSCEGVSCEGVSQIGGEGGPEGDYESGGDSSGGQSQAEAEGAAAEGVDAPPHPWSVTDETNDATGERQPVNIPLLIIKSLKPDYPRWHLQ